MKMQANNMRTSTDRMTYAKPDMRVYELETDATLLSGSGTLTDGQDGGSSGRGSKGFYDSWEDED